MKRNWDDLNIDGWMGDDEMEWLYQQAQTMQSIVEIGCWQGRSTYALCLACPGTVYAVDHFKGSKEHQDQLKNEEIDLYARFIENVGHFTNLKVFKMSSEDASKSPEIPDEIDMVFIDGDHEYNWIMTDLKCWSHRAKKLLCGHDRWQAGVPDAIKKCLGLDYEKVKDTSRIVGSIWCRENESPVG